MEHALRAAGEGTAVSLHATGAGKPLYEKLGFKPVRRSVAFRGQFRVGPQISSRKSEARAGTPGSSGNVRVATEADLSAILTLDRAAYGADRERILTRLPAFADRIVVLEADEGIVGYAAAWRTEPFMVIGPLMARTARRLSASSRNWPRTRPSRPGSTWTRTDPSYPAGHAPAGFCRPSVRLS